MSTEVQREEMEKLRMIREMCGNIIYQTHAYLNDGNIRRFVVVENEMQNIQDQVEKIRELRGDVQRRD